MPEYLDSKYDLTADTYTAKEQSFAVCEVGDAKEPSAFYPQVKIMRWENEANFSVRLVHDEAAPTVITEAGKIKWVGQKVEAHFYDTGSLKEDEGGYEFEIVLKEPPKSNIIQFTIQTKGLNFFYQPPLSEEEVKEGYERPDNVVGSYGVYHQTMTGDYMALGGQNYKAGKAFHIYRPRIEDAKGNWCWGDLNIDEKAGLLTVTIPQEFLDKAIYPVRHAAGLTFGYTTLGASYSSIAGYAYGRKATSPEAGTATSFTAGLRCGSSYSSQCALYNYAGSYIQNTEELTFNTSNVVVWKTYNFITQPSITAADYALMIMSGSSLRFVYDTGTAVGPKFSIIYPTWPSSPTWLSENAYNWSMYCTYTATPTGGIPPGLLFPQMSKGAF